MEQQNQIYLSVLKTAIQKSLSKNFPLILADAVEYLEGHNFEVKQRKKRSKTKPLQNINDLQKKTQSVSAQKMKTTAYFNVNTNRVNSDSKKIKDKHPNLQFGNLQQNDKTVWICGTPGHLENTLNALKQSDEKSEPIFQMTTISEEPKLVEEPKPPVEELPLIKPKKLKRRKKKSAAEPKNSPTEELNKTLDLIYAEVDSSQTFY